MASSFPFFHSESKRPMLTLEGMITETTTKLIFCSSRLFEQ